MPRPYSRQFSVVAFPLDLPPHLRGRRMWLLAAFVAAPLWNVSQSIVAVMILSLALAYITAAPRRKLF